MNSDRHEVLKAWIAAILWLIVIAIESTALLSASNTSRILYPLLHFLFGLDWEQLRSLALLHSKDRTCGRLWHAEHPAFPRVARHSARHVDAKWTLRWATIAILGTALVASLDEWHQSFIPSRTGRWQDVVLDTCAGFAAQLIIFLWWMWRRKNEDNYDSMRSISN